MGEHAGPEQSFVVRRREGARQLISIGSGHYYVGGVLVENQREVSVPLPGSWLDDDEAAAGEFLVYLDVWEQDVGPLSDPAITDPGIAGVTTAVRLRTAWLPRVRRLAPEPCDPDPLCKLLRWVEDVVEHIERWIEDKARELEKDAEEIREDAALVAQAIDDWLTRHLTASERERHAHRIKALYEEHRSHRERAPETPEPADDDERMRAMRAMATLGGSSPPRLRAILPGRFARESSLYRVEVHAPGPACGAHDQALGGSTPSGFAIRSGSALDNQQIVVLDVPADEPESPREEDWLEIRHDALRHNDLGTLAKVAALERQDDATLVVTLARPVALPHDAQKPHAVLRRGATFKVSRDDGATSLAIRSTKVDPDEETNVTKSLVVDAPVVADGGLEPGDWLEIVHDGLLRQGLAGPMVQVESVVRQDDFSLYVTLGQGARLPGEIGELHAFVRRWDGDPRPVITDMNLPIDGDNQPDSKLEIVFDGSEYRVGDYWLIPVRQGRKLEWPSAGHRDPFVPARGEHLLAPLALVAESGVRDLRCTIKPLTER